MPKEAVTFRDRFINAFSAKPGMFSTLIFLFFMILLAAPGFLSSKSFGGGSHMDDPEEVIKHLPFEALLIGSLVLIIGYLGAWGRIGIKFQLGPDKRYPLIALAFPCLVLFSAFLLAILSGQNVSTLLTLSLSSILLLGLMTLMIGTFEELLFRGVLQNGISDAIGPIKAVFLTALLFGLAHYTNWINGKPFLETSAQVFNAFSAGLLLGGLRLVTKSIWPCILIHALWDFSVFLFSAIHSSLSSAQNDTVLIPSTILALVLFAKPLFGLYLIASHWKTNRLKRS